FVFAGTIKVSADKGIFPWINYSVGFENTYIYDGDTPKAAPVKGELHAGIIVSMFTLVSQNPPADADTTPFKDSYYGHSLMSMYNDTVTHNIQNMEDWDFFIYSNPNIDAFNHILEVDRGGKYIVCIGHFPGLYEYRDTVDILDIPSLRMDHKSVMTVGDTIKLKAKASTGYPFDMNALTGNEKLKCVMAFSDNDITFNQIDEREKPLKLKEVDRPLIAGYDTMMIERKVVKPGVYAISMSSEFAPANRKFHITVNDTLRATISLDKESYVYGVDKQAKARLTLDYGYPYIYSNNKDSIPTVALSYALGANVDTMFVSNDTLRSRRMSMEIDLPINLELVTDSVLKVDSMKAKLNVSVDFNHKCQFKKELRIPFIDPTGVKKIEKEAVESKRYNIMGLPVDERTKGIIIENGKKRLNR
ncbi:MAG: hypothetical protein HUK05_06085, partial [Prevotella sp.]|nr:hypothetical protein [Prevotella sp.]